MKTWVNFQQLREKLDFEEVLRHYKVEIKRRGNQHQGFCPLPNHKGNKRSPSFSANLERGIFHCFGCGAKGNILEFAALMENIDPKNGEAFRRVALELQERFCPGLGSLGNAKEKVADKQEVPATETLPVVVNPPLDFELKGLDQEHPYLLSRGFLPETIAHFGLGVCSRGLLKERVAIPLHDHDGKLVGYAGRVVDDAKITEDNPRYRFPSKRGREGKLIEFRKTLFLYNGFRIEAPADDLIVVEGFASVWWLFQCGLTQVVATMGADCSDKQAELVVTRVKPSGRVWIMPDGDDAGRRFAQTLLLELSPHRFVRWIKLDEGAQATDMPAESLKRCFVV